MAVNQLSDGREDGTVLGQSDDKLAFFGGTATTKPTCTLAAALTAGTTTPANIAAAVDEIHAALAALGIIA
ncbi:MAG TPA: hypothetical protein VGE47_17130 [Burkholderiaceae bacterium]